jgi:hypothetical protein
MNNREFIAITSPASDAELVSLADKLRKPKYIMCLAKVNKSKQNRLFRSIIPEFDITQQNYYTQKGGKGNVYEVERQRGRAVRHDKTVYNESEMREIQWL